MFRVINAYGNIHFIMSQEKLLGVLIEEFKPVEADFSIFCLD